MQARGSEATTPVGVATADAVKRRVAAYYDATQILYTNVWSRTGVHYGLWTDGTRGQADAIRNLDRFVATRLRLAPGQRVLDAGCGVGGTSVFFAEAYDVEVLGLTLSRDQLRRARANAAASSAPVRPTFRIGDYLRTGEPDGAFDGVYAIESSCYAEDKRDFLREAWRVLRPGGRLVVADGFVARTPTGDAGRHYRAMLEGMALTGLADRAAFHADLEATGFVDVRCEEQGGAIEPSSRRIWLLSLVGLAVCAVPCRIGLFPTAWRAHGWAGIGQRPLFRDGWLAYCIFSAAKPRTQSGSRRIV